MQIIEQIEGSGSNVIPNGSAAPRGGGGLIDSEPGGGRVALGPPEEILGQRDWHEEVAVAEASGLAVKLLRKARAALQEGPDFLKNGQKVGFTKKGLRAVLEAVSGLPLREELLEEIAQRTLPEQALEEREAVAAEPDALAHVRRFYMNPRLVQIELPDKSLAPLKVRDSKNFRVGMEVPVRWNGKVWELTRRLPRFPGRW